MYIRVSVSLGHRCLFIYLAHTHILKDLIMTIQLVVLYLSVGVIQFPRGRRVFQPYLVWHYKLIYHILGSFL